jgi:hypothetical protein
MIKRTEYQMRALKRWPKAEWVECDGSYALVTDCGGSRTVQLYPSQDEATQVKMSLDECGCCGACVKSHRVVSLL